MRIEDVTNIHVGNYSPFTHRASVGWEANGARFHFWINTQSRNADDDTIFKNPPLSSKSGDPDHFNTRRLDMNAAANSPIVMHVLDHVFRNHLIAGAIAEHEAQEKAREAADREIIRVRAIEAQAIGMHGALVNLLSAFPDETIKDGARLTKEQVARLNGTIVLAKEAIEQIQKRLK